jgi:hypothetical protein
VRGLSARLAAIAAVAIVGASPATAQAPPAPPSGWENVTTRQACAVRQGPVLIGTPDGKRFSLFVSGTKVGDQPMRSVALDGKPYLLSFTQVNDMGMADLDASTLGALVAARQLTLDWPEGKAEVRTEGLLSALNLTTACGARLEAKRVADVQRHERKRQVLSQLPGFSVPGPAVSTHPTAMAGAACFKKREWSSGFNKNCVYDCLGSEAVQTIGMAEFCPMSIRSPR